MNRLLVAFVAGLLFASGLAVAGMTEPSKILAFLDVGGAWDPSLAFVMVGAIAVSAVAFRVAVARAKPILGDRHDLPSRTGAITLRLVVGAVVFGLGWGLSGFCPGPAIVSLGGGRVGALVFVVSMIVGMLVQRTVDGAIASRAPES